MKKVFAFGLLAFVAFLIFSVKEVAASDGLIELRSTNGNNYRCFVASLKMQDNAYRVLVSCRNLIYPANDSVFNYILWANPVKNGQAFKLGALGLGRASFSTKTAFSNLFVTTESSSKTKTPEGQVVMRGSVTPITFLEEVTTPTPTSEEEISPEEQKETPTETPAQLSTRERLVLGLRRAGIVSLLALVAIIGLVFVITRSRG